MGIKEMLEAKEKCYSVIYSCKTTEHVESARNYINNYFELYEDVLGYGRLKVELEFIAENL